MIAPYHLPTLDEMELTRLGSELDKSKPSIEEDAELTDAIQQEIRKHRAALKFSNRRKGTGG